MGVGGTFGEAYGKAMEGAGIAFPLSGKAFISVTDADKGQAVILARRLANLGFDLVATYGTTLRLREVGLECESVFKVNEGRPNIADLIRQGEIALIINTPLGRVSHFDEQAIRKAALQFNVPCVTTITGAEALVEAISTKKLDGTVTVRSLQEIHAEERSVAEAL
jgi:carbamoyl-phosphate synthase large subunit